MKVLLFHPVLLPPKDYGGTERVVLWLAKGLVARGHEVVVGALPGSRLPTGTSLLEIDPAKASAEELIPRVPSGTDVVHFMAPPSDMVWKSLPCPAILTVHGNGQPGERFSKNSVFLSQNHALRHGAQTFVYNGIDPDEYRFEPRAKENWFLFLSKTSWRVKNVRGAIRACSRAKAPLWVAGGRRPVLARLEVALTPGMRWVGPVAGEKKAMLLSRARALLFPVLWPEPFGLAVAEALISGTPVIASRQGSLPELVPSDVGTLLEPGDIDAWVSALSRRWDPERCRAWALERFHFLKMAEEYEKLYRKVAQGEVLNPQEPLGQNWRMQR